MQTLGELYEECRSYIHLNAPGMSSAEILSLYVFVEQYVTTNKVPTDVIDRARAIVEKYKKIENQTK